MKKVVAFFLSILMIFSFTGVYADTYQEIDEHNVENENTREIRKGSLKLTRTGSLRADLYMQCNSSTTADYIKAEVMLYKQNTTGNYLKVWSSPKSYYQYNTQVFQDTVSINVTTSGTYYCEVTFEDKVGNNYHADGPYTTSAVGL